MSIKTVLFDLDGTLLPMDQDIFVKAYFGGLSRRLAPHGYEPQDLIKTVWAGTAAMIQNDGKQTNEEAFWMAFCQRYGEQVRADMPHFDAFYAENFDDIQAVCGYTPQAAKAVAQIKEWGLRVALATNPIFPAVAVHKRLAWAGLTPSDFELCTTYENSHYCKPNPAYYREIAENLGVDPSECLMVGNDVSDDTPAAQCGMAVFLLTDCLINKTEADITAYPNGGFTELLAYIEQNR